MQSDLIGSWKIEVISPLGSDRYSLTVNSTTHASIGEMRGKMNFDDVKIIANTFEMVGRVDTPTKGTIYMRGVVNDNQIQGKISVGQYCTVDFRGVKDE